MTKFKYPRTPHLPWSLTVTDDDRMLKNTDMFKDKEVVVTEKIDGSNTTMYNCCIYARSLTGSDHISEHWIKNFHAKISYLIPDGYRICGENMYAEHSIHYSKLPSYFILFSVYHNNLCLDWDLTKSIANKLHIPIAHELYRGKWNENIIKTLYTGKSFYGGEQEGYVVRTTSGFLYDDFKYNVAKFVRPNHVKTNKHWKYSQIKINELE